MEIKELNKTIEREKQKLKKERQREIVEERKEKERTKKHKQQEKGSRSEKLKLLDKINAWKNEFIKTSAFRETLRLLEDDSVIIFYSSWGHVPECNDGGFWSRVHLYKDGNLEYKSGYKWMGFRECFFLTKDNVDRINCSYLKKLYKTIKSKEVYKTIKREIEEWLE